MSVAKNKKRSKIVNRNALNSDDSEVNPAAAEWLPRRNVDLQADEYTEKFANADIFAKKSKVNAMQITADGLANRKYSDLDVREEGGRYLIDTYVMAQDDDGARSRKLENTREVAPGQWITTNPKQRPDDYPNNYAIDGATFAKKYEPTDADGVYCARGMARIIRNDTGESVEIMAPWGEPQDGGENCYFAVSYDPENPDEIGDDRYILSENDFATYESADGA